MTGRAAAALLAALVLAACSTTPPRGGAYYKDDGPGANPPPDLDLIADAQPRAEALNSAANRPYEVFGKRYVPLASLQPFRQRGIASWYGRRFNGQPTSSGERYDMYAMTAAHPVLPIPSYARVTNLANGRSVVVRINDRGPFHSGRIIDLSYAAAHKLGYVAAGSARVEVDSIVPGAPAEVAAAPAPALAPLEPQPAAADEPSGVYLQLGAFSARQNAESFRAHVYRELAWLSDAIHVFASGGLYKLHLGPYRSQDEARAVAQRIESELNFKPVFIVR
ncbi:MAG TPA: septal ring lytic transglycosylase RlpA family protein [Burkholderiales bacterium]|nr:septal ring lytic transglycosylase RlpA family protein [Burkholderiales bacterium]